jgi:membrane protein EpsK
VSLRAHSPITTPREQHPPSPEPVASASEPTRTTSVSKKRFLPNVAANVLSVMIMTGIHLWFTPYLIHQLGFAAYGFIPLALRITRYFGIFTSGLTGAVGRFYAIDVAKDDQVSANKTFNTALVVLSSLTIVVMPCAALLIYVIPRFMNVPSGMESDVRFLFGGVMVAFLVTAFSSSFGVSAFARHRFDLKQIVEMVRFGARVALVLFFFSLLTPRLWQVGLAIGIASALALTVSVWIWRVLSPYLRISPKSFDRLRMREITDMSVWTVVGQIGALLFISVDIVIVNKLFGPTDAGKYGSILVFGTMIRTLGGAMATVLTPAIMAKYADGDYRNLFSFAVRAVKLLGLCIALPIGLLVGLAQPLLSLWLGTEATTLAPLLRVMTCHLAVNLAVMPLLSVHPACNRMRIPSLVSTAGGTASILLAIGLARGTGLGMLSVALAGAIALTVKNTLFVPLYTAAILHRHPGPFLSVLLKIVTVTTVAAGAAYLSASSVTPSSWPSLAVAASPVAVGYIGVVYLLVLNADDKRLIGSLLRRKR